MSPSAASGLAHELECAEAAFAYLIEQAPTHARRRELTRERDTFRREIKRRLNERR